MSAAGVGGGRAALEHWLTQRWYGPTPIWWLVPLVPLFVLLAAWSREWRRRHARRLPVPVVVVGNLTVGGTGKTPLVIWLVEQLRARGHRPGVVSRGHGRDRRGDLCEITADSDAGTCGDEPLLIWRRTSAPVVVGADRVAAGHALLAAHPELTVVVSDDGLQHLGLARDVEVVVIDGARGLGNGWRLPAGPLRESPARLQTVDLVVCNGPAVGLDVPGAVTMELEPTGLRTLAGDSQRSLRDFVGQRVHALAGIGNPERFFAMLTAAGVEVMPHPRADHAEIGVADLPSADGLPVFLTEKDAVKLVGPVGREDVWVVPVAALFAAAEGERLLTTVLAKLRR